MDFNDWMEEAIQSITQNATLMGEKFTAFTNEFEQEAIQLATKDANNLAYKFSTEVFQPIAKDLGVFTREVVDEFVQPIVVQAEVFFEQIDEKLIKPAGTDLRKLHEDLGIAKEMKELYRTLDISSEEEFLRILCAFIALGGTTIGNYVNLLNGNIRQQLNQQRNISERGQTLAQAAKEIQLLLKQLEKTNPQATEKEKISYVNDETTPSFKRRAVGALQAGGESAIEEFLDNPYVNVGKAIVKGWLKPE
jgi:hypothetical protein